MDPTILSILTGLISGVITAVVTYFATLSKVRLDLTIEYDKELHKARLAAYLNLWPLLKPLARYSAERPLTYQLVKDVSSDMRNWYFDGHGIYLSPTSRDSYFALKQIMQDIIDNMELKNNSNVNLDVKWIKPMLESATTLRKTLSEDVGTRRKPFI